MIVVLPPATTRVHYLAVTHIHEPAWPNRFLYFGVLKWHISTSSRFLHACFYDISQINSPKTTENCKVFQTTNYRKKYGFTQAFMF